MYVFRRVFYVSFDRSLCGYVKLVFIKFTTASAVLDTILPSKLSKQLVSIEYVLGKLLEIKWDRTSMPNVVRLTAKTTEDVLRTCEFCLFEK